MGIFSSPNLEQQLGKEASNLQLSITILNLYTNEFVTSFAPTVGTGMYVKLFMAEDIG